jgi:hypothetical protein
MNNQTIHDHYLNEQNELQEHIIRWKRLVRICKDITHKTNINISLTTIQTAIRAGVVFNSNNVDIVINGSLCKSEGDIIEAIAHEITHVVDNNYTHDNTFNQRMDEIRNRIIEAYTS